MAIETALLSAVILFGFVLSWGLGAQDVSRMLRPFAKSAGLTLRWALILVGVLEVLGVMLFGRPVADTIRKRLLSPMVFQEEADALVLGMLAALIATVSVLGLGARFFRPLSAVHALVGAVVGFAVVLGGVDAVKWSWLGVIVSAWFVLPAVASFLSERLAKLWKKGARSAALVSAGLVVLAHAASAGAAVVGPLAAVISILNEGVVELDLAVPRALLALVGVGVAIGFITWGWREFEKPSKSNPDVRPVAGSLSATLVLLASALGVPTTSLEAGTGRKLVVSVASAFFGAAMLSVAFYGVLKLLV